MNDSFYHIMLSALAFLVLYVIMPKTKGGIVIAAWITLVLGLTKELYDGNLLMEALKDLACNLGGIIFGIFVVKGIK